MPRKIIRFEEYSMIQETFLYFLGAASKEKEENPELEIYLSFQKSMTESKSFFRKLCIYSFENNLGIMVDSEVFLPEGGKKVLSQKNFDLLLKEQFG